MGDKLSKAELAAIAAYRGKITVCPPGNAFGASPNLHWLYGSFESWLSDQGLSVVPAPPDEKAVKRFHSDEHGSSGERGWGRYDVVTEFKKAA